MKKYMYWIMVFWLLCSCRAVGAEKEILAGEILDIRTDLQKIDTEIPKLFEHQEVSFSDTVMRLMRGEVPFSPEKVWESINQYLFREISDQKKTLIQVLVIVLFSAVTANFIRVFENAQIAEISFYMMYMLISVLLVQSFSVVSELVKRTCETIVDFMELLLPSYLLTVIFSSGKHTGIGMYEITVFGIQWMQIIIIKLILPAINVYLTFLVLSQMSKEDMFSKFASLIEMSINWILKTLFTLTVGMQTVQCLTAPAVDRFQNSAAKRMMGVIPGIGNMMDSAAETVTGAALVLKNAVGIAGIGILLFLCFIPVIKLAVTVLLYRMLGAVLQPVCDKRMTEGMESVAKGAGLLMRTLIFSVASFLISLAMVTAFVYG